MLKKSKRLTRRSYRRKLIMFGVSIFASLSLTATGFAAWVLSTNAQKEVDGSLTVGAVADRSVDLQDIKIQTANGFKTQDELGDEWAKLSVFKFEPVENDVSGLVQWDGENAEAMSLTYQWTIGNYQVVASDGHYVEIMVPESIKGAVTNGYLTFGTIDNVALTEVGTADGMVTYKLPINKNAESDNQGDLQWTTNATTDDNTSVTFTLTLKFGWGSKFGNMNPSQYLDSDSYAGKGNKETVKNELVTFGAAIHGLTNISDLLAMDEQQLAAAYAAKPITYKMIVHADVTSSAAAN